MLATRTLWNAVATTSTSTSSSTSSSVLSTLSSLPSILSPSTDSNLPTGPRNNLEVAHEKARAFLQRYRSTIVWSDAKTWKDPNYQPPLNGPAYFMIRQILTEKPRSFHQIVEAGLEIHAKNLEEVDPESEATKVAKRALEVVRSGKRNAASALDGGENRIPEGHPFKSNKYLKTVLLETLETHQLLHKANVKLAVASKGNFGKRPSGVSSNSAYAWFLSGPKLSRENDPQTHWSIPRHWQKLINNQSERKVLRSYKKVRGSQLSLEKARRQDSGRELRTEEEIWTWDKREPELTTPKQRLFLSRRHRINRDKYERRKLKARLRYDKLKEEVRVAVEKVEKKVAKDAIRAEKKKEAKQASGAQVDVEGAQEVSSA